MSAVCSENVSVQNQLDNEVYASDKTPLVPSSSSSSDKKESEISSIEERLSKVFDSVGYGLFHVILTIVSGLALASDWIEILCVSFIIPVAEGELHLSDVDKATLNSMIFVGIIIGSLFWGSLSDAVGRKKCLVISLLLNSISGLCSSLMPNFGSFLFFRLLSGIGVGGSVPVTFSYFSEFLSTRKKERLVIAVSIIWVVMEILMALVAWGLLSNPCLVDVHIGSMPFRSWRVFTMLCTLPAITAALLFIILPESPSWLYITGRYEEAERTLQYIARVNHNCNIFRCKKDQKLSNAFVYLKLEAAGSHSITTSRSYVSISPSGDKSTDTTMSIYSDNRVSIKFKRFCSEFGIKIKMVFRGLCRLFRKVYLRTTVVMLVVAFCLSFGSWGLGLWFPEYFKHLLQNTTANGTSGGCSVVGENCTQLDSTCSKVYFDTMLEAASALPGTVIGIFTIYVVGGRVQIAMSMIVSGVSVFLIWWLPPAEVTVVVLSCLFSGFTILGWNGYNVINVEYFGTDVRSTAIGLLATCVRASTIVSTFIFGALQTTNPGLPIFLVSMTLFVGGIMPLFLPLSSDPDQHSLLGKQFRKWMSLMWSKIKKKCTHA